MEKNLLKLFKLVEELDGKQDKVYAQISYYANHCKHLEIVIRSKKDFSYIKRTELDLANNLLLNWNNITKLFEECVGGIINE